MSGGRHRVRLGHMSATPAGPDPAREHRVLRTAGMLFLALDLGFLTITAGLVVLAGFGVLASPLVLAVITVLVAAWVGHLVLVRRHPPDATASDARARERRGY